MTMKKQIIYMVCATALLSSCHIYKAYDRPDTIETSGIYRDPVSATDTLAATDTANMGNLPWKEVFRDPKLQALIEEGLANNVDMQAAIKIVAAFRSPVFPPFFESGSARNHNQNGKYGVCESLYLAGGS